jgi:hypothetical protein
MKKLFIVCIIAAALVGVAMIFHFIYLGNRLKILKKADLTFEDTFVDARGAKKLMLYMKPSLLKAGIKDVLENQITSDDK